MYDDCACSWSMAALIFIFFCCYFVFRLLFLYYVCIAIAILVVDATVLSMWSLLVVFFCLVGDQSAAGRSSRVDVHC